MHVQRQELFWGLQHLADRLNELQDHLLDMEAERREAWLKVSNVVNCIHLGDRQPSRWTKMQGEDVTRSLEIAADMFFQISIKGPVILQVAKKYGPLRKGKRRLITLCPSVVMTVDSKNPYTSASFLLWQYFFHPDGYWRLKTCRKCARWFVNQGTKRPSHFCSRACADTWWTRRRRHLGRKAHEIEPTISGIEGYKRVLAHSKAKAPPLDAQDQALINFEQAMIAELTKRLDALRSG